MTKEHPYMVTPQPGNESVKDGVIAMIESGTDMSTLFKHGFTGFFGGQIAGCGGLIEQWKGRAIAWTLIDLSVVGRMMIPLHKHVLRLIDSYQPSVFKRIEMTVDLGFNPGHRWARLLGFEKNCVLDHYGPDGRDHTLYSRVRL